MPTNSFEDPIARVVQARTMPYRQGSKRGGGEHSSQFILQLFGSLLEEAKEHAVLPILLLGRRLLLLFLRDHVSYSCIKSNKKYDMPCHSMATYMFPTRRDSICRAFSFTRFVYATLEETTDSPQLQ